MKINHFQNFKATFLKGNENYLKQVENQAKESRRWAEYQNAQRAIAFNFPNGSVTKVKSYPDVDTFILNPKSSIEFTFKKQEMDKFDNSTSALDSFIKLASMIRKIAP